VSTQSDPNTTHSGSRELLIVEDEAITALHLRQYLEHLGYKVTGMVATGEQALQILEDHRPDLILMNITLAGELSGTETAKIVDERFRVPVVYVTAYNDGETVRQLEATGAYGFVTKPIREKDLDAVIKVAISRHKKHLELRETERKGWENVSRQAHDQLEQFTYAAGHDLKEPLRTARTSIDLLARLSASKLNAEELELLTQAREGLIRIQILLEDLLAYAQAGLSQEALHQETPADAALDLALDNLRSAIAESGAIITREALPVVRADPSQLAQVFQNLLANAAKYRRPEQVPQIHVAVSRREQDWEFSVRDSGIGFDQKYAEQIFSPFKRLHGFEQYPGSGLGLAICRKIVEAHGGRIWAESRRERGSIFSFSLPRAH
jgi:two-component system, sensor histidine kinase and response regulator